MVCDAKQHLYLKDIDGTFLGSPGYVLPEAEYEWDGDPARGIGDYRIPAIALTDPLGTLLDANVIHPYKGRLLPLFRNDNWLFDMISNSKLIG